MVAYRLKNFMTKKAIVILGPTGCGKSSMALKLAKKFNGYLISADSRQVYKYMDIGTNKDKGEWKNGQYVVNEVPEYMVDFVEPDQEFSLYDWLKRTGEIIKNKKKLPIIVGGTGLYISALTQGYALLGDYSSKQRKKLEKELNKKGKDFLLEKIKKYDPGIEQKIDVKNPRRLLRVAEVVLQTKKTWSPESVGSEIEFLKIGIKTDREKLYKKINQRVDKMIDQGLIKEVKSLIKKGFDYSSSAMSGIGYRQICSFLRGQISRKEAVRLIKRDTRRYAKRQLTWFRKEKDINWVADVNRAEDLVGAFLKNSE